MTRNPFYGRIKRDPDHIHQIKELPKPIPDKRSTPERPRKPYRYVCILCHEQLKIASGVRVKSSQS